MKTNAILACLVSLGICLAPRAASAWGSAEHSAIARSAHILACKTLKTHVKDEDKVRFAEVCPDDISPILKDTCLAPIGQTRPTSFGTAIPPYKPHADDFAFRVSEGTALAGDYLKEPADFGSVDAERSLSTIYAYLFLANDNDDHFHPRVVPLMLQHLAAAREIAARAHDAETPARRLELLNAASNELVFALHFGQDAFAAGHMGFNRAGSSAGPSQRLHAVYNAIGRRVVNYQGDSFVVFGDGHYCNMDDTARFMVVATSASILLDVLGEYVLGPDRAKEMLTALDVNPIKFVPSSAVMGQALVYSSRLQLLWPFVVEQPQISYNDRPVATSLATVVGTSRQSVSLGGGMVLPVASSLFWGLSGAYIKGLKHEFPIDIGFTGGAFGSFAGKYRVEGGGVARVGFIGSGLVTIEPCVLVAYQGGGPRDTVHREFFSPRLQALLELGQLAYLRAGVGYEFGFDLSRWAHEGDSSGVVVSVSAGFLIGAFGGGPLDLGNISRGF